MLAPGAPLAAAKITARALAPFTSRQRCHTGLLCALGQASQLDQFQVKYPDTVKRAI
jgi:hypothetical protein